MDKKHIIVEAKTLEDLFNCFANKDEYQEFMTAMMFMIQEVTFSQAVQGRNLEDREAIEYEACKQVFLMALFFRENMDVIQTLVKAVDYKRMTDEENRLYEEEQKGN